MNIKTPYDAIRKECGYSLRNLTEHRCPECGRPFDPDNENSFVLKSKPKPGIPFLLCFALSGLHYTVTLILGMIAFSAIATSLYFPNSNFNSWPRVAAFALNIIAQPIIFIINPQIIVDTSRFVILILLALNNML